MKETGIYIVGGTGGMGKWLADFLRSKGYDVRVSGKGEDASIPVLAAWAGVVVIAVPIHATLETIERVGPHMRGDDLLMDLTSLKVEPVKKMLECSGSEIIGLHPLFGPAVKDIRGENVVVCPARGKAWLPWVRELFMEEGAHLEETTPKRHDEMMTYVQVLTHLGTIATGLVLRDSGIDQGDMLRFSTPAFRARMAAVDKIFSTDSRLYGDILTLNPRAGAVAEALQQSLSGVLAFIGAKDAEGLVRWIKEGVAHHRIGRDRE